MKKEWITLLQGKNSPAEVLKTNQVTEQFGLTLTEEDAKLIMKERTNVLREQRRIEFGEGIVPQIIYEFCDSDYIDQNNYVETILRLQEIFYLYKNEMLDEITDDELLAFMRERFEEVCFGDLDYLAGTCLDIFAQAIRAGYMGHRASQGREGSDRFDIVERWDAELYMEALRDLAWR